MKIVCTEANTRLDQKTALAYWLEKSIRSSPKVGAA
jgi:hypothetical protein